MVSSVFDPAEGMDVVLAPADLALDSAGVGVAPLLEQGQDTAEM